MFVYGGVAYQLTWSAVDLAKIEAPKGLEEEADQLEMRRLIAQRNDRTRTAAFRLNLGLRDLEAAAAPGKDHGDQDDQDQRAIGMALQPPQLLL
jgi:hypothetical protein